MNRKRTICLIFLIAILSLCGCGSGTEMQDGFYTAEMSDYSHGWKEYVCIMVKNDQIVYVEFNAKDPSGYIKAWDNAYMENMVTVSGTYPNEYTRYYAAKLLEKQNSGIRNKPAHVRVISGRQERSAGCGACAFGQAFS